MLTFNVYDRVFEVRWNGTTGTAFTVDIDQRQYLVSAKHVFEGIKSSNHIEVFLQSRWQKIQVKVIGISPKDTDVVVLATEMPIIPNHPLRLSKGEVILSQDVFFVGYPYGLHSTAMATDGELHLPLVKKACLSGYLETPGGSIWILDGFNNPGFSGGPVISAIKPTQEVVVGIVSAYRFSEESVHVGGEPIEAIVKANTGIIYAYSAAIAIDLIAEKPNGTQI